MSKYTTELRFICEMKSGFSLEDIPDKSPEEIIAAARPAIFDFDYPIYRADLKEPLELKILRHYYTREIGQETFGLWQWRLQSKLNEIMPRYNKLYEAEFNLLAESGINNIDVTIRRNSSSQGLTVSSDESSTESKDAYSDTPQGGLQDVEQLDYLTDYRNIKNSGETSGESSTETTGEEITNESGYRGSKTKFELFNDFYDKIIDIDQMIINDLSDLFFLLY